MTSSRPAPALLELTRARVLEFLREPGALFWVFGFPVLLALVLGLAFRSRPAESLPVAVVDGPSAARAAAALAAVPELAVTVRSAAAAAEDLRLGRVEVVVALDDAGATLRLDPTRPESRLARLRAEDALQRAAGRRDPLRVVALEVTEPGSRYVDFLIPGLIGLNLMGSSMWGIGFAVVSLRTRKLLKRFVASPMRRADFLVSLMLSRLVFLALELVFLVAFGWLLFGVAVRGSLLLLAAVSLLGAASFTGVSVLIAARARTVETAAGLMNLVMIPMWLLSGAFFSYERFPAVVLPAIRALPLTALNDALREVMLEGAPAAAVASESLVLAVWGVVCFALALRFFRWT